MLGGVKASPFIAKNGPVLAASGIIEASSVWYSPPNYQPTITHNCRFRPVLIMLPFKAFDPGMLPSCKLTRPGRSQAFGYTLKCRQFRAVWGFTEAAL